MNSSKIKVFTELIKILEQEIGEYEKLTSILEEKQNAIIKSDIDTLRSVVADEQAEIKKISGLIKERETTCRKALKDFAHKKEIKMSDIIEFSPTEVKDTLIKIRQVLLSNLERISRLNRENEYLLNFSIDFTRNMVNLLLDLDNETEKIYDSKGVKVAPTKCNKMLDFQI